MSELPNKSCPKFPEEEINQIVVEIGNAIIAEKEDLEEFSLSKLDEIKEILFAWDKEMKTTFPDFCSYAIFEVYDQIKTAIGFGDFEEVTNLLGIKEVDVERIGAKVEGTLDLTIEFTSSRKLDELFKIQQDSKDGGEIIIYPIMTDLNRHLSECPPLFNYRAIEGTLKFEGNTFSINPAYNSEDPEKWKEKDGWYFLKIGIPLEMSDYIKVAKLTEHGWLIILIPPSLICGGCESYPCQCIEA